MKKNSDETFTLSGQSFKILDQFTADCGICCRRHGIIELSRDFIITCNDVQYHAEHRCMYCTFTGELFVTPVQKKENYQRIRDATSRYGRRFMPSAVGGIR